MFEGGSESEERGDRGRCYKVVATCVADSRECIVLLGGLGVGSERIMEEEEQGERRIGPGSCPALCQSPLINEIVNE